MSRRPTISLGLVALALCGCPARPGADAGADADVVLAPIDVGTDAPAEAALDAATDGPTEDATSPDATALDVAPTDGGPTDGGPTDARGPRCDPDAGLGEGGCVLCPVTSSGLLNQCTRSTCARFDNGRCGRLLPDGGLPPLP
jgi:hypothetical protein